MTDGSLFQLATKRPPEPHAWGPRTRAPKEQTQSGFQQAEKACPRCTLVRITVVGGPEPRAYRFGNGPQFYRDVEPICVSVAVEASA